MKPYIILFSCLLLMLLAGCRRAPLPGVGDVILTPPPTPLITPHLLSPTAMPDEAVSEVTPPMSTSIVVLTRSPTPPVTPALISPTTPPTVIVPGVTLPATVTTSRPATASVTIAATATTPVATITVLATVLPTATPTPETPTVEVTVPTCDTPPGWIQIIVQSGQTVSGLAQCTGTTDEAIVRGNCLLPGEGILPGQTLHLPAACPTEPTTITPRPTAIPSQPGPGEITVTPERGPFGTRIVLLFSKFDADALVTITFTDLLTESEVAQSEPVRMKSDGSGTFEFTITESFQVVHLVITATQTTPLNAEKFAQGSFTVEEATATLTASPTETATPAFTLTSTPTGTATMTSTPTLAATAP